MAFKLHIAYLLLVISTLMPVIPVIPHHHHADGRICLKHDLPADCCDHHHHGEEDPCCGGDCVAIHIFEQTPGSEDSWHFTFTPEATTLFFEQLTNLLSVPLNTPTRKQGVPYRERLHGTQVLCATGLRAPPCPEA